jgi:hypothetical protein
MAVCNLDRKNAAFGEIPQDREITQSLTALLGQMEKEANATKDNSAKTIRQYFAITKEWLVKIFARKKDIVKGHDQFYNNFDTKSKGLVVFSGDQPLVLDTVYWRIIPFL